MSTIKAGTTSTTAYQVEADTTGDLVIATGASANVAMTVNSSGNIGIGTSSPTYKFHVAGTGGYVARFDRTATTSGLDIGADSSGAILQPFGVDAIQFYNAAGTTRNMLLNASGNLGLGVTPSAWGSGIKALDINTVGGINASTGTTLMSLNAYYNGSNWIYKTTGTSAYYEQTLGKHAWYTAASGTAGNTITFTQALTLNANGNLALQGGTTTASGVGVTFPASQSASSDANCLDDYEEGTWTVVFTSTGTAPTGVTYTHRGGWYRKIGSVVIAGFGFLLSNKGTGGTGDIRITGLPFTSASFGSYQEPTVAVNSGGWTTADIAGKSYLYVPSSTANLEGRYQNNSDTAIAYSEVTNSTYMNCTIIYYV